MTIYAGPKTADDSLVLCVDAANPKSYPGTGSNCYNIATAEVTTGILVGDVSFDPDNQGSFLFDGTGDRIGFTDNILDRLGVFSGIDNNIAYSMEAVIMLTANVGTDASGAAIAGHSSSTGIGFQVFNSGAGNKINIGYRSNGNYTGNMSLTLGEWYHVVFTRGLGTTAAPNKIYINGELDYGTTGDNRVDYTTDEFQIGDATSRLTEFPGRIALCKVYSSELTADEVSNAFNSIRARYGI